MSKDNLFSLSDDELDLAKAKNSDKNKLGFAVLLKYFQLENHYPKQIKFIDPLMLNTIANQLNIAPSLVNHFDWEGRSTERFRGEIRGFLGYRAANQNDIDHLKSWLTKNVFQNAVRRSQQISLSQKPLLKLVSQYTILNMSFEKKRRPCKCRRSALFMEYLSKCFGVIMRRLTFMRYMLNMKCLLILKRLK